MKIINGDGEKIKIFGLEFAENNKNNYQLVINNKILNLCEYYKINNVSKTKNLKVILLDKNKIPDKNYIKKFF